MNEPTKRTDVPSTWADKPGEWWSHVADCSTCSARFERPAPTTIPAGTLEVGDIIEVRASSTFP